MMGKHWMMMSELMCLDKIREQNHCCSIYLAIAAVRSHDIFVPYESYNFTLRNLKFRKWSVPKHFVQLMVI